MAGQVSPGIVLRERDLTNSVATASQANTAAIVGAFEKGPVGVITSITTERQLLDTFGKPNANNFEDWYVAATFLGYGGQLQVVRVADSSLKNAVTEYDSEEPNAPLITSYSDFEAQQGTTSYKFAARTAGIWGNGLKVSVIDGSVTAIAYSSATYHGTAKWSSLAPRPADADTCHVVVVDESGTITGTPGTLLETFLYVSRTSTSVNSEGETNYYPNVINRRSRYVYADELVTAGEVELSLDGGVDNYQVDTSSIETALEQFNDVENINIDFILTGGSITYGATPGDATKTKALKAVSIAANRKDCVAFVSPYRSFVNLTDTAAQKQAIIDYFSNMTSTSYAVFDSGYKYIYDRYNDVYRYIPCCGDVAGLCVQTSVTLEDWFSPAGLQRGNLRNAVKLAYTPTKTDRDELYQNRINPITSFPGQGIVLFGDKTALATPSAFDRINVRRLFLAIQKRVASVARNVLFELNDTTTRNSFFSTVNAYMAEVQAKRGVTDYLVVCDESNNTPEVIDRNEFVAEIYVKPARSINYVTITFVATKTGVSFEEVTGQV
jgi:phage tail sheath protein FI